MARLLGAALVTAAQRQTRATSADELCRQAYAASAGPAAGVALVAVGGYGRGELAPHSDLDVVLVHEDGVDLGELGSSLWYPLWDSGRRLDHSVRSMGEVRRRRRPTCGSRWGCSTSATSRATRG